LQTQSARGRARASRNPRDRLGALRSAGAAPVAGVVRRRGFLVPRTVVILRSCLILCYHSKCFSSLSHQSSCHVPLFRPPSLEGPSSSNHLAACPCTLRPPGHGLSAPASAACGVGTASGPRPDTLQSHALAAMGDARVSPAINRVLQLLPAQGDVVRCNVMSTDACQLSLHLCFRRNDSPTPSGWCCPEAAMDMKYNEKSQAVTQVRGPPRPCGRPSCETL
jgi:hypothetical protein